MASNRVYPSAVARATYSEPIAPVAPAFVLDDDRLSQALARDLRHHAGTDIRAAAGRERHDEFDLTRGIRLLLRRDRRTGGEQGGNGEGHA